jgi:hypothetical protein
MVAEQVRRQQRRHHHYDHHHHHYHQHVLDFTKMEKKEPILIKNLMAVKHSCGSTQQIHTRKTH